MTPTPGTGEDSPAELIARAAHAWARAVDRTSFIPLSRTQIEDRLAGFVERLSAVLDGEPFDPVPARQVGADLVRHHFTTPETLGRTVEVLAEQLPALAGAGVAEPGGRTIRLLAALTIGYTRALRDRTLDEQESVRRAAMLAHAGAEQALRASEARFRHAALHDALTGLPNRASFEARLAELFAHAPPDARVGVCFVDLTSFKSVNDRFGHQVGDLVLVTVADRLRRLADDTGHLVARFGGDEFVILVESPCSADDVVKVADRALEMLAAPVHAGAQELSMAASVGIVERAVAHGDATDLMRAADMTLHWAKSDGEPGWLLYDDERSQREMARYALLSDLPAALDREEIVLDYQPLVRLADRAVVGVEALARWRHPRFGVLAPARFIALAEESGLIVPLGAQVLRAACRQGLRWARTLATPPYVSVNVAVRQLRHDGLVQTVADALDQSGLPPHLLQLEITESGSVDDDHHTRATLHALTGLGVRLAIDDFGSGYSNLGYLQTVRAHQLKIDRRFLRATPADGEGRSLLPALVDLAHTLDMTALVEGVETAQQAAYLARIGCDTAQGWFFGRPQPAERLTRLLD